MHTLTHACFSPFCLCSILQTWRWACEGSGCTFGQSLSKVVWIDEKQRDGMGCHLGQWLFVHHHQPGQDSCPSIILLTPRPIPLFPSAPVSSPILSGDSATFISSYLWDCTKKPNENNPEENSLYICVQYVWDCARTHTTHTPQSQTNVSTFCIISHQKIHAQKQKARILFILRFTFSRV